MSCLIPLSSLQKNKNVKKVGEDLVVKPISQTANTSRFGTIPSYMRAQKEVKVEAFEIFGDRVALPFSYTYHHLNELFIMPKKPEIKLKFKGDLLDRQREIRDQVFEILNRTRSVVLCLHTGFGKTIFALYIASKMGLKVLVLCHRKIIMDQWVDAAEKYLPGVDVDILDLAKLKKDGYQLPDILIANTVNIPKLELNFLSDYGCVIVDEIHTICTEAFAKSLTRIFPSFLIGLSATPHRSDGMDRIIELYVGPEMVTKEMKRIFNVYKMKTGFTPDVKRNWDGSIEWNSVLASQAESEDRNRIMVDLVRFFNNRNILILVKRKDHALVLRKMMLEFMDKSEVDVFFGTMKCANDKARVLIGTVSKAGVGFDAPHLNMLITGADVEENFMQYLGRVFRRDMPPIYIDLVDEMSTLSKHSATRLKICKEVGGVVRKFEDVFPDWKGYRYLMNLK